METTKNTKFKLTAKTDVGKVRDHNEDNYVVCPDLGKTDWFFTDKEVQLSDEGCLIVIADGMGGLSSGEVASAIAVETVQEYFKRNGRQKIDTQEDVRQALSACIIEAQENMALHAEKNEESKGMGTTIVIAFIKDGILNTAWVGDSRCYVFRNKSELYFATKDHSYVQELVDAGKIKQEQAFFHPENNVITRSLGDGAGKLTQPDFCSFPLLNGDRILLCSDGLNGMLMDEPIAAILAEKSDISDCAGKLINEANLAGGHDNITLVLLDLIMLEPSKSKPLYKLNDLKLAASHKPGDPFKTHKPGELQEGTPINSGEKKHWKQNLFYVFSTIAVIIICWIAFQKWKDFEKKDISKDSVNKKATSSGLLDSLSKIAAKADTTHKKGEKKKTAVEPGTVQQLKKTVPQNIKDTSTNTHKNKNGLEKQKDNSKKSSNSNITPIENSNENQKKTSQDSSKAI